MWRCWPFGLSGLAARRNALQGRSRIFLAWLGGRPAGYFINADRNPKPKYLIVHRPGYPRIDRARGLQLIKDYIKVCADDPAALEEWAAGSVGGEPILCPACFG